MSIKGSYSLDLFDPLAIAELRSGRTGVNHDTSRNRYTAKYYERSFLPLDVRAIITVPLRLEGKLVAILAVTDRAPRTWHDREIALMQVVGERTWIWLDQQRVAEALRESEARKAAILDAAFDGIVSIDHRGVILEFNQAAEKLFGFARAEAVGHVMAELIVPPFLREAHERGLAHYLETGEGTVLGRTVALPALRADGSEFPAEIAITLLAGQGLPTFTASIRAVSGRQRADQERADLLARLQTLDAQIEERVAARTVALAARVAELERERESR
jgi:PAS domain S-box-containing protein